ncbi:MAG: hypothetical protein MPK62_10950 [Alphaproteobacteria bacterium]|nr:hypothetical protein [Alphaproteobacteria bacterium]
MYYDRDVDDALDHVTGLSVSLILSDVLQYSLVLTNIDKDPVFTNNSIPGTISFNKLEFTINADPSLGHLNLREIEILAANLGSVVTNVIEKTIVIYRTNLMIKTNVSYRTNLRLATNLVERRNLEYKTNTSLITVSNERWEAIYSTNFNYNVINLDNDTFMITAPSHVVVPRYDKSLHIVYQTDKNDSDIRFYFFDNSGRILRVLTPGNGIDRAAKQAVWQFKPGDLDEKVGIVHVVMEIGGIRMLGAKQEIIILGDIE